MLFSTDFGYLSIDTAHQLKLHQAPYLENLGKHSSCCDSRRLHNRVYVSNRFNLAQRLPIPRALLGHGLIITHLVFTGVTILSNTILLARRSNNLTRRRVMLGNESKLPCSTNWKLENLALPFLSWNNFGIITRIDGVPPHLESSSDRLLLKFFSLSLRDNHFELY